jgi:hypothetical protein
VKAGCFFLELFFSILLEARLIDLDRCSRLHLSNNSKVRFRSNKNVELLLPSYCNLDGLLLIKTDWKMIKQLQTIHPFVFILICTILESTGDAIVRKCLYQYTGTARIAFLMLGMVLLLGYGIFLNLAPVEFSRVVGLYIATLFVVWQVINYISFKTTPNLPIVIGGSLIVVGGLIVTFWNYS